MQQFIVDAFESGPFTGNPAAVIPLQDWPSDGLMQQIAEENNLSETAFFAPEGDHFRLRWFTPSTEVDLCGHATLATAHVLFEELGDTAETLTFSTLSGDLSVGRLDGRCVLDFPAVKLRAKDAPGGLFEALGVSGETFATSGNFVVVVDDEAQVRAIKPNFQRLKEIEAGGICVTAPASDYDYIVRMFAPRLGIDEDPATGSAHCGLAPYWGARLAKEDLRSLQASTRTGLFECRWPADASRVEIAGSCRTFSRGEIEI